MPSGFELESATSSPSCLADFPSVLASTLTWRRVLLRDLPPACGACRLSPDACVPTDFFFE